MHINFSRTNVEVLNHSRSIGYLLHELNNHTQTLSNCNSAQLKPCPLIRLLPVLPSQYKSFPRPSDFHRRSCSTNNPLLRHLAICTLFRDSNCLPDAPFLARCLNKIARGTEATQRVGYMLAGVDLSIPVTHLCRLN